MSPADTPPDPRAYQDLAQSEARYRTLVENPNFGVFLLGPSGGCLYVSAKIEELTGYTADELYNMPRFGFRITHPDDQAVGMRAYRRALLGHASQHQEFRLLHRDGSYRWTSAACFPVRGDGGRVSSIQVVLQDISERKQAEEELARERRIADAETVVRLRIASMDHARDLFGVVAAIGDQLSALHVEHDSCTIQIINSEGTDFISCSRKDAGESNLRPLEILHSLSWEPASDNVSRYPWVCDVWRTGRSSYVPCTDDTSPLPQGLSLVDAAFSHGTLALNRLGVNAFDPAQIALIERFARLLTEGFSRFFDIVERDRLEGQLRQSQKMEAVGEMIAGVSHNFNNMLTMILGNLELARSETSGDAREFIDDALDASTRAADLIRELMQFSRRDDKQMVSVDVVAIVRTAVRLCQRTIGEAAQLYLAEPGYVLPSVHGNASLLQQIVVNLCLNARDAIEAIDVATPRIDVEVHDVVADSGRCIRVRVRDNGSGMDDTTRERVFEPFFTTKAADKGTGLGLTTVYGIVRDHGGRIEIDSEPGSGTQFSVFLPVGEDQSATPELASPRSLTGKGETILLVEDEAGIRHVLRVVLERAGYCVIDVEDGELALQLMRDQAPAISLVILDLSMPKMSGVELLQNLHPLFPDLRVLIFTGQNVDLEQLPGASDILTKPAHHHELLEAVGRVLGHV